MLFINKFMFITPNLHIYASEIPKFPPFSWVNPDLLLAPSFPSPPQRPEAAPAARDSAQAAAGPKREGPQDPASCHLTQCWEPASRAK